MRAGLLSCLLFWIGTLVAAQELRLPANAEMTREVLTSQGRLDLPTGPTIEGWLPSAPHEGQMTEQAWRISTPDLTTLQILSPLREQVLAEGWEIVFECATNSCGGFDFRHAVTVLPPPEMFVNLGDFMWLSAVRQDEALALMVSRTQSAGFVQITRVGPAGSQGPLGSATAPAVSGQAPASLRNVTALPSDAAGFGAVLEAEGRVILSDLAFETGSATLAEGDFASLRALAGYLEANPLRRVVLVGHTDAQGGLEGNIALSKRRAGSVLERMVSLHDVARTQVAAEGMGYLAPVATNLTAEGRDANRRVEAVLLSDE